MRSLLGLVAGVKVAHVEQTAYFFFDWEGRADPRPSRTCVRSFLPPGNLPT